MPRSPAPGACCSADTTGFQSRPAGGGGSCWSLPAGSFPGQTGHREGRVPDLPDLTVCPGASPSPRPAAIAIPGGDASGDHGLPASPTCRQSAASREAQGEACVTASVPFPASLLACLYDFGRGGKSSAGRQHQPPAVVITCYVRVQGGDGPGRVACRPSASGRGPREAGQAQEAMTVLRMAVMTWAGDPAQPLRVFVQGDVADGAGPRCPSGRGPQRRWPPACRRARWCGW
jgi:hypothetical protein